MPKNLLLKPVVKWVGGKRQLLGDISPLIPPSPSIYVEPFVGGGAVLLHAQPNCAIINDYNEKLINVYRVIRDDADALLELLSAHEKRNSSEYFYEIRGLDRTSDFEKLSDVQRAARIIYLNKTCYNGMFRVNSAGQLNVPYGRYKHPNIVNRPGIKALFLASLVEYISATTKSADCDGRHVRHRSAQIDISDVLSFSLAKTTSLYPSLLRSTMLRLIWVLLVP